MAATYVETFDDGPGGWMGWDVSGATRLEQAGGALISRSPWWVDYNHAPPGGGYLHLLFCLHTHQQWNTDSRLLDAGGVNRFIDGGYPKDFTDARLTLGLRGEVELGGARLVLLAQAQVGDRMINHVLTGQPFSVEPDGSQQTVQLTPDPTHWTCLGSRHDRTDTYGSGDIADVLRDLNGDLILVLHGLDVVPAHRLSADPHRLRAGRDYDIDQSRLPSGVVALDEVRIEFADE